MPRSLVKVSDSFTRPANATQYADGDLVANSTTAGSVVPLKFNIGYGYKHVVRLRLEKTDTDIVAADFVVKFFGASPTFANGDNGAMSHNVSDFLFEANFATMVSGTDDDYAVLNLGDTNFTEGFFPAENQLYAVVEADGTYTPASGEVFTLSLWVEVEN